jgi:signal recognition particle receptor subunit beta
VVFVADSQLGRLQDNAESMRSLKNHLHQLGYDPAHLPLIMQYNKRDLPDRAPIAVLEAWLGRNGIPHIESVAIRGIGVFDTLKTIINAVVTKVQREIG